MRSKLSPGPPDDGAGIAVQTGEVRRDGIHCMLRTMLSWIPQILLVQGFKKRHQVLGRLLIDLCQALQYLLRPFGFQFFVAKSNLFGNGFSHLRRGYTSAGLMNSDVGRFLAVPCGEMGQVLVNGPNGCKDTICQVFVSLRIRFRSAGLGLIDVVEIPSLCLLQGIFALPVGPSGQLATQCCRDCSRFEALDRGRVLESLDGGHVDITLGQ